MTLKEVAAQAGINLDESLKRFSGMERLVIKFLKKFPADTSFQDLEAAVKAKDYKGVEAASHSLKGVAGNLSLTDLFNINQEIVDAVRGGHPELVDDLFAKDKEAYDRAIAAIKALD